MAPKTIAVADDAEFNALVQALTRDVVDAHIHWDQHTALQAQMEKWPEVQAEGWPFWYYAQQAHQLAALASLARVDRRRERRQDFPHLSIMFTKYAKPRMAAAAVKIYPR